MNQDILIRKDGRAGRITLNRPQALNALTYEMCLAIEAALIQWQDDTEVALLIIDASGDRAFCSGGDIADMYASGTAGDWDYGRRFWRDEYRMNARLFEFPKPVVSFLQGFTMGGGVGVGCHGSHRIVDSSAQIAMPECGIGLLPDVGGSLILARAPGRLGEYLGVTGRRMGPADAILAGFADYYIDRADWEQLKTRLAATGDYTLVDAAASIPPAGQLAALTPLIDAYFGGETWADVLNALTHPRGPQDADFCAETLKLIGRNSPLAMACHIEVAHRVRANDTIRGALRQEYRFTHRAMEHSDFLEGIRAAIIDKDRKPRWRHAAIDAVTGGDVLKMTMPLGADELTLD